MISYPNIDPIVLRLGPLQIRWYGLMYVFGILLAYRFVKPYVTRLCKLTDDQFINIITACVLGVLFGGRLGYIVFYNASYYLSHPLQIFSFWHGGMSYHGGAIGCIMAILIMARWYKVNTLILLDYLCIGTTFGIGLGRIGNFINGELYGRITTVPWAMVFPSGGISPRHPSQLYESFFEGFVLFMILYLFIRYGSLKPGFLCLTYMLCYGSMRFCLEFFREPDAHLGFVLGSLTMGQCLSLVMIFAALLLWVLFHRYYKQP